MLECVERAELEPNPTDYSALEAENQTWSRALAFILNQVLQGGALQVAMSTLGYNFLETWRIVFRREEPISGAAQVKF